MKTTIVLAVLLAATPAFAQSSGGPGAPGATIHDYKLGPHQRTKARVRHHPVLGRSVVVRHPVLGHPVIVHPEY
jgi:hypothetical protein